MSLTLILPIFNESKNLANLFNSFKIYNKNNHFKIVEIIFINDCSADNSLDIILNYKKKEKNINVIIIDNYKNYGSNVSFLNSLKYVNSNFCLIYFADVEFSINIINKLYKNYFKNKMSIILRRNFKSKIFSSSALFWFLFSLIYKKGLKNICSIFITGKDLNFFKKKKFLVLDVFFLKFLDNVKLYQTIDVLTKIRKVGVPSWSLRKRFFLFYNLLFFQTKVLLYFTLMIFTLLAVLFNKYLLFFVLLLLIFQAFMQFYNKEKIKYKVIS
jgi:glycosyltransferase involved in cell wall biosynthesis